ncbi:hypothetical protein FRC12_003413 [Ceratobasidium sp. 428]|nr:hypothetical protein FRC12_003413 [Ceratobasidium sp. 428]
MYPQNVCALMKKIVWGVRCSMPQDEPVAINQDLVQGIPVAENAQNAALPPMQVIQGANQVIFDPTQPIPPAAGTVLIDMPNPMPVVPNLPQPPVQIPGPAPAPTLVANAAAANENPVHLPLMRTLYGFPDIVIEEENDEGEEAQDGDENGA